VAFRRSLVGNNLQAWHHLVAKLASVQLIDQRDQFIWSLKQNGQFTIRSMYNSLIAQLPAPQKNVIWKLKLPLKVKIFVWYLQKGVVLTKDNLAPSTMEGKFKMLFL
jgi:hypothetical protein